MTVTITSEVLGKQVGEPYTGPLESWLLHEGYARDAADLTTPIVVTPTAAVLVGSANAAATVGTDGSVTFATKGGVQTVVNLLAADTAAGAATKIDNALAGKADAAIVSSRLNVTSVATGPTAYVEVVAGTAAVLTALHLAVGQVSYGTDGRPVGAAANPTADIPANDPTSAANREAPYFPSTPNRAGSVTIANDATNLTKIKNPAPGFDMDVAAVDAEAPSNLSVMPRELPLGGGKVSILGDNLEGVTGVTFGGTAGTALDASKAADGVITVVAPAKAAGTYDVVVTDNIGTGTKTGGVLYA